MIKVSKEELDLAYRANENYDDLLWFGCTSEVISTHMAAFWERNS